MPESCSQPDICAVRFKSIEKEFDHGDDRMTRIDVKIDKVLFRLLAMAFSMLILCITISFGFYKGYYVPSKQILEMLSDKDSPVIINPDDGEKEEGKKTKPVVAQKDG